MSQTGLQGKAARPPARLSLPMLLASPEYPRWLGRLEWGTRQGSLDGGDPNGSIACGGVGALVSFALLPPILRLQFFRSTSSDPALPLLVRIEKGQSWLRRAQNKVSSTEVIFGVGLEGNHPIPYPLGPFWLSAPSSALPVRGQ